MRLTRDAHLQSEVGASRRERILFDALRLEGADHVKPSVIMTLLSNAGIAMNDPRVKECVDRLRNTTGVELTFAEFSDAIAPGLLTLERV